jgi:hypothetical protein
MMPWGRRRREARHGEERRGARAAALLTRVGIGIGIGIGIENEVENTIRFRSRGTVTSTSSLWPLGSPRDSLSGNSGLKRSILNPSADWNADAYS